MTQLSNATPKNHSQRFPVLQKKKGSKNLFSVPPSLLREGGQGVRFLRRQRSRTSYLRCRGWPLPKLWEPICGLSQLSSCDRNEMKNLEAKFRLDDLARAESRATALGYTRRAILNQRDTFF